VADATAAVTARLAAIARPAARVDLRWK
jgi:hypothetical protein